MKLFNNIFSDKYYETRYFERDGKIYEYIGIRMFKKIIMYQVKNRKVENYNIIKLSLDGLISFEKKTRDNEKIHVILGIYMLVFTILIGLLVSIFTNNFFAIFSIIIGFIIGNIIGNIYPICLQRYNRIRINKILNRSEADK